MNSQDFRRHAADLINLICNYRENIRDKPVTPDILAGFLTENTSLEPPNEPEKWETILKSFEEDILPGVTHWQHPNFFAYFPSGSSFPSILGELAQAALGIQSFTWSACPSSHELEMIVLDWFADMLGLPNYFQHRSKIGGGCIQGSASDGVLVTMIAARRNQLEKFKVKHVDDEEFHNANYLSKFVVYCSDLAHLCVEKAAYMLCIRFCPVASNSQSLALHGDSLQKAITADRERGLIPLYVCATLGTTSCTSVDDLDSIGRVCQKEGLWLHVDAAYAGNAMICEEFRHFMTGIENVHSFSVNPHKWLLVNFDSSLLWVRQVDILTPALTIPAQYLAPTSGTVDFRHWQLPLSRRFRSLKLWFLVRCYGVKKLQEHVRKQCLLAKRFESYVINDSRFALVGQVNFGLVSFRLQGNESYNRLLIRYINQSQKMHLTPAIVKDAFILRFCVCYENSCEEDVDNAWKIISSMTDDVVNVPIESLPYEYGKNEEPLECNSNKSLYCDTRITGVGIPKTSKERFKNIFSAD